MNINPHDLHETATRISIGVSGSLYSAMALPLSTWVAIATFVYMLCQIVVIAPKVFAVIRRFFKKGKTDEQG
jgi:hypothetical protein